MDYEPTFRPTFRAVIRDLHSLFTPGWFSCSVPNVGTTHTSDTFIGVSSSHSQLLFGIMQGNLRILQNSDPKDG